MLYIILFVYGFSYISNTVANDNKRRHKVTDDDRNQELSGIQDAFTMNLVSVFLEVAIDFFVCEIKPFEN